MDVHDSKTRSYNMSRISGKNTKPEILVRAACHKSGLRFRLHRKNLPGKPDLVFAKYNTVIFVNGCYWHSHNCRFGSVKSKTNAKFWQDKREATVKRDARNTAALEELGWRVLTYWECELKDPDTLSQRIREDFLTHRC
ncbi:MAG: very short patch repair endonuclease [Nitrospinaceae bacterium]|jgi:DNA mismatch endonuclease (patch repair protein)|nr:very short patch repair endonuclease [Nitrospinaceae bacterium]